MFDFGCSDSVVVIVFRSIAYNQAT